MSNKIGWCEETWNPVVGCTKISEGCKNCYAERMAYRLMHMEMASCESNQTLKYTYVIDVVNKGWNGKTHLIESALEKPFHWGKSRMIFVCSMGDLFHESVPFEWIDTVFKVMINNERHIFQILTKRPERMVEYFKTFKKDKDFPSQHIWFGVTTENQDQAEKRIPYLLQIPAKVRFVSYEPALEEIDLECYGISGCPSEFIHELDWVIAGFETGAGARPFKKEWIESLYQQCKAADVPFFDKRNVLGLNIKQFPKKMNRLGK
ncbi:MAG: phage Gp37/Gp68 family protein [Candidatus Nanoarchaeia archaeon]|nr:phage Gp37/Gp68 family protein [Candidatus Nanoarchaeia archaeon]